MHQDEDAPIDADTANEDSAWTPSGYSFILQNRLYIGNFGHGVTEDELSDAFGEFGEIVSVRLAGSGHINRAFVEYRTEDSASQAIAKLHDMEFQGRFLRVYLQHEAETRMYWYIDEEDNVSPHGPYSLEQFIQWCRFCGEAVAKRQWEVAMPRYPRNPAAVLFLDVDGVLHPESARRDDCFHDSCMANLKKVIDQTEAAIVLSSTWRLKDDCCELVAEKLEKAGIPRFGSRTPCFHQWPSNTSFHYDREREILAWVQFHTPRSWVLVGDGKDLGKEFEGHFVRTDAQCGLSVDDANRIICSMNKKT